MVFDEGIIAHNILCQRRCFFHILLQTFFQTIGAETHSVFALVISFSGSYIETTRIFFIVKTKIVAFSEICVC